MIDTLTGFPTPDVQSHLEASEIYLPNDVLGAFMPMIEHHDKLGFIGRLMEFTSYDKIDAALTLWNMIAF